MSKKIIIDKQLIEIAIQEFKNGKKLDDIRSKIGVGRNKIISLLKEELGLDEYKNIAKKNRINISTTAAHKANRNRTYSPMPLDQRKKIGESNKGKIRTPGHRKKISDTLRKKIKDDGFWLTDEQIAEKAKKARDTKIKNGTYKEWGKRKLFKGRKHTPESKKLISENRKGKGSHNRKLTDSAKLKLSKHTKQMWADGKFDMGNGLWRSNIEKRVESILKNKFPKTGNSFRITNEKGKTYVYDIHIPELNLLIEVNGDYWHYNPKKYDESFFDERRNVYAYEIWEKDKNKIQTAKNFGFNVATIWQDDLEKNEEQIIEETIKGV